MTSNWLACATADPETHAHVAALAGSVGLAPKIEMASFCLFASPDTGIVEANRQSLAIIGKLFRRDSNQAVDRIDDTDTRRVMGSAGASLLTSHWGGYVAIGVDRASGGIFALRDPSGAEPCLWTCRNNVLFLASDAKLLLAAAQKPVAIDWATLASTMTYGDLRGSRTALESVNELLPGTRLDRDAADRITTRTAWSPWDFVYRGAAAPNRGDAITRVGDEVRRAVRTWHKASGNILVELSGGLDSSTVVAALAERDKATAITFVTPDRDGDERLYARAVAAQAGIDLHEAMLDPHIIEVAHSAAANLPRPSARMFAQDLDRHAIEVARMSGATAFFSGGGGDNVFAHLQSAAPAADRLRTGSPFGALRTVLDISRANRADVGTVARRALTIARRRHHPHGWKPDRRYLVGDVPPFAFDNPWLEAPDGALAGARAQIRALLHVHNHLDGHGRSAIAPMRFPLLSQPLVELCLSLPTWMWLEGGIDRSLVREAFRKELPPRVAARRDKGGMDGFVRTIFAIHRTALREMVLGGRLAAAGLIDPECLAALFAEGATLPDYRLLMLADVEAWLDAWSGVGIPAPIP